MRCPFCGADDDRVVDSRAGENQSVIRRRRECLGCGRRFTTYETVEEAALSVVKRDGRREPFDRAKIVRGITVACEKRPISRDDISAAVDRVERVLFEKFEHEVPSSEIGELVMGELKILDEVAYVRFASVYKSFQDSEAFMRELKKLVAEE
ncbi:MAG: transcriptional repressor NrdR [Candidatus Coatesbacteria bacterium]|nr:MAG: transcriptional repressor NrdR [Candidatus Coatesbacteria bacterium]